MKIAYLSTFYPYRGGIAQFNASLYRALEQQNHQVIAYNFIRQYPDLLFPGKSQYVSSQDIADPIASVRILDTINPISYFITAREIEKNQPDLIVMKYWMPFFSPALATIVRYLKKRNKKLKAIAILDNVTPHEKRFYDKILNQYFVDSIDGFVTMSSVVFNDLQSFLPKGKTLKSIHPFYNHFGSKLSVITAREHLKIDLNKRTILFFGLIRAYKGLDILIDAFDLLDDNYQLCIAGESYQKDVDYISQINRNKNHSNIYPHIRYIEDWEVPYFFSAADICVLPYRTATQSGITAIANHFETPLIVTDVGGLRELVEGIGAGIVVNQICAEAIAESIKSIFENNLIDTYKQRMTDNKIMYSWENFAKNIVDFYQIL